MSEQQPQETPPTREPGAVIHRRETSWQIYFPFGLGLLVLLGLFLGIAIQPDPVWRDRSQAIGDFLYVFFCTIPVLLICMFPLYLTLLVSIYGMSKIHDGTERPLRKLEDLTQSLAERIETVTTYINEKTTTFSETVEPYENAISIFEDDSAQPAKEEPPSNE